ncbi:TonB family protein [Marinifilum sp.]|uniref:TonB family protein n=1 Tax=Marinifilum sp. TaxID=2033137 RepID=UPI003BA88F15
MLTLGASLLIPSLKIPFQPAVDPVSSDYSMLNAVVLTSQQYLSANVLQEVVITADKRINWYQYIGIVYLIGLFLLALRFFKNLIQLLIWMRTNKRINENGMKLIVMNEDYPPFSFLNSIFVSDKDYQKPGFAAIFEHERVHVDQLHTFDLLVLEILTVVFWINPLVWMYKYSIQEVHEYLADDKVVSGDVNPSEYKMHIVNQFAGGDLFRLANNFGQSTLKKRISMLGKIKTPKVALVKLILLIPIVLLLLSAFAFTIEEEEKLSNNISFNEIIPGGLRQLYSFTDLQPANFPDDDVNFVHGNFKSGMSTLTYKEKVNPNQIYRIADIMPEYPGGINVLKDYIANEIHYPKKAQINKTEGKVYVSFVVGKSGDVKSVYINRGVSPELDKEALRVVSSLKKWTPGKHKGNLVNVAYTLPIDFKLEGFDIEQPIVARNSVFEKIKNASDYHSENLVNLETYSSSYTVVEKMPQFPGGSKNLRKWVARNIKYPVLAVEQGYEGKVFVRFNVNKDGSVSHARIIKGANIELNQEALRVINSMPYWIPGEQYGVKVKVSYTIPIRFTLN